jgi:hypothetical protein
LRSVPKNTGTLGIRQQAQHTNGGQGFKNSMPAKVMAGKGSSETPVLKNHLPTDIEGVEKTENFQ